jgi:Rap guanine nucleotide exchange factor 1
MLPGNGTILLETIANINSSIKSNKHYVHNSAIISCNQQIQIVLGKIIKICDDALLNDDEEGFINSNKDVLKDLVDQLQNGVKVNNDIMLCH